MKTQQPLNSYNFPEIYKELDIDIKKLYCVMLNVDSLSYLKDKLLKIYSEEIFYTSPNYSWVKGFVGGKHPHVTLLYGLLEQVTQTQVETVLKGLKLTDLEIEKFDFFESPNDEEYYTVIAKVKLTKEIIEGHQRLSLLPHVNTFMEYKAHLTICYIKKDKSLLDNILEILNNQDIKELPITQFVFDNNSDNPKTLNI